jgi:hypothetical protein
MSRRERKARYEGLTKQDELYLDGLVCRARCSVGHKRWTEREMKNNKLRLHESPDTHVFGFNSFL